ncbi:MAG: thiamine-phosphate kinase [Alphaproteobacteria bacterium]|nr:thiamine-phosphate kinase [Alphaproteobacteria bacterium]
MARLSEDEVIATFFAPLAGPGAFGLRDDAAVLSSEQGEELVVTKDMLTAGVHFFADDPPNAIARKALRVNLSDLAAKAARPCGFVLGLALPEDWTNEWLASFSKGLGEDAAGFGCPLLGGDIVRSCGPLILSVTAFGTVPADKIVRRGHVVAEDVIFVSGTIGDAALGLRCRRAGVPDAGWINCLDAVETAFLTSRYILPQPRLDLREALRAHAHAAMDISDGFAGDLTKFLQLTGMTTEISGSAIPLSEAARKALDGSPSLIETILTGGDDYELLCAVPPSEAQAFAAYAAAVQIPVHAVGVAKPGEAAPVFKDRVGRILAFTEPSFQHF